MEGKCRHRSAIDFQSTLLPTTDMEIQICLAGLGKLSLIHKEQCCPWKGVGVGAYNRPGKNARKIRSSGGLLN